MIFRRRRTALPADFGTLVASLDERLNTIARQQGTTGELLASVQTALLDLTLWLLEVEEGRDIDREGAQRMRLRLRKMSQSLDGAITGHREMEAGLLAMSAVVAKEKNLTV